MMFWNERLKPDKTICCRNNLGTVTRKRAVVCPSCGVRQDDKLLGYGIQPVCRYCGSPLALSRDAKEETGPCQNHPDVQSVGACKECGGRFCENCLYVLRELKHEYVCETCLEGATHRTRNNRVLMGLVTIVIGVVYIPLSSTVYVYSYGVLAVIYILEGLFSILRPVRFPLLASTMRELTPNPDAVYVKCLNCGSAYYYGPDKVGPDGTVVCQNCNRTINLQGDPNRISGWNIPSGS